LFGVRAVLKTAEMRLEEDRRGLTSRRSLVAGGVAWSEGNDVRGDVRSASSGGRLGERTPADDDTEVHKAAAVAPSSGARCLEQRRMVGGRAERAW
jgi:hypothetical protein